jgi:hypothetical protein
MMTLAEAASYFDRTPVLHPDNDTVLFYGQVEPYDDSRRDAGAAYRRILSVAPGTAVPAVVKVLGKVWIVGKNESDALDEVLRDKYVLQPALTKASVSRADDFLAGVVTSSVWLSTEWLKDGKELEVSSNVVTMYTVIAPQGADLREHDIIWYSGAALMMQKPRHHPSGYIEAEAVALDQTLPDTATLSQRTFSPASGAYTTATTGTAPCMRVRWQSLYLYEDQSSTRYQEGDATLVLPAGTTLSTNDLVTLSGKDWKVLAVQQLAGCVCAHARGV